MKMSAMKQLYHDITPVTLQLVGGAVSSSLYCREVQGLSGLAEAFLVEIYRCKLCQFTCGLRTSISSHLQLRHRLPTFNYLSGANEGGGAREEADLEQLDLGGDSKQTDEDEEFLLYNMLDNMSPSTCDISTEGGLQVAHTCEVSTLFEEEEEEEDSSIFPLKGASLDVSCTIDPSATQEEMAQSAHLMSLGLCRKSTSKPPLPPATASSQLLKHSLPLAGPSLSSELDRQEMDLRKGRLLCHLCPLTMTSRWLLDVHVQSHQAAGGFRCVCCNWTANSWEELEPHWRSHSRRSKRSRVEHKPGKKKKKKKVTSRPLSCTICQGTFRKTALKISHQQTHQLHNCSDKWRDQLIGGAEGKETEHLDSQTIQPHTGSLKTVTEQVKKKNRKMTKKEDEELTGFCCSLCPRTFSSKLTLRRHLGVHGGQKPFTCPHCSYSSRLKASLLQHLRTHTGERPYRCAECSYASIDRSSLLRHSRTHSQEKPYRCQHCDYSSIQKKSLDLHSRRHHTGEAFSCQQCEYSSPDRQLLLRHIRRHHAHALQNLDLRFILSSINNTESSAGVRPTASVRYDSCWEPSRRLQRLKERC